MTKLLFLFTIMITLLAAHVSSNYLLASDMGIVDQIKFESVNPDNEIMYKFKRLREKISETLTKTFNKDNLGNFYLGQADKRLAEYAFIIKENKRGQIETSSSRYVSFIGLLSMNSDSLNVEKAKEQLNSHVAILKELSNSYPYNTAEWRFVQQALESAEVLRSNISS